MLKTTRLFSEDGKSLSIGRITFWIILSISIYFWFMRPVLEFPPSLLHMLYVTSGYNLAKKGLYVFNQRSTSPVSINENSEEELCG